MTATVLLVDAIEKSVTWTSSNNAVASVTNGVVTAHSEGTASITAKAGNQTATCVVTVVNNLLVGTNWVEPYTISIYFNSATNCTLSILWYGEISGTYIFNNPNISVFIDNETFATGTINGNTMTLFINGESLVFTKQ